MSCIMTECSIQSAMTRLSSTDGAQLSASQVQQILRSICELRATALVELTSAVMPGSRLKAPPILLRIACSQSAPQQCLEALLRSGAARPVLHHRRSALQRLSGAPTPGRRRRCSLHMCERHPQHLSTRRLAGLAAASLQAVPREVVVQATDAMRVAHRLLARRR